MMNKSLIIEKSKYQEDTTSTNEVDSIALGSVKAGFFPFSLFDQQLSKKKAQAKSAKAKAFTDDEQEVKVKNDSIKDEQPDLIKKKQKIKSHLLKAGRIDTLTLLHLDENIQNITTRKQNLSEAVNKARNIKVTVNSARARLFQLKKDADLYTIEKQEKYAQALACLLMFLIGAPLGAIIKKGGLGVPTIIAIFFFIIYYAFTSIGEKQAKSGVMDPYVASWMSDVILLPFGLYFLKQARVDARIFEVDAYLIRIQKLKQRFARNKNKS